MRPIALAALASVVLAGCGSGSKTSDTRFPGNRDRIEVRLADCADWKAAGPVDRGRIIESLKAFAGGPTGSYGGRGAVLDNGRAGRVLDSWCDNDFARGFKLYKLYTRAAAFSGH